MSTLNKLVKSVSILAAALVATASIADADESLQLSQLTAGFDAETKYMASCFACHSTGAAGAPKVVAGNAAVWDERLAKRILVSKRFLPRPNYIPPRAREHVGIPPIWMLTDDHSRRYRICPAPAH